MTKMVFVVTLATACGAPTKPPPTTPPPRVAPTPPSAPPKAQGGVTAAEFCDHFVKLAHCEWTKQLMMDLPTCLATFDKEPEEGQQLLERFGPCVRDHSDCMEVANCFSAAADDHGELRGCFEEKPEVAVGMPVDEWQRRKGADVTKFSQASSTKDAPIEVCGIPAENEWLAATACDDGSTPIHDHHEAEVARVGNVGRGGRCGSIVDLYRVKCPEATYDIYLDGYVCPRSE
jgi:hypothetical protein